MHTNAQILTAVVNKWIQPYLGDILGEKMASNVTIKALENKIRSTGWVSPNWCLMKEMAPFVETVSGAMVKQTIGEYIAKLPEESIPEIAHSMVEEALKKGELALFDGMIIFDENDLRELKRLIELNLKQEVDEDAYIVKA